MSEEKNVILQIPPLANNTKEYKIKFQNEEYSVKIGKTAATYFMIIIAKPVNDNSNCYNIAEYCINDLLDLNKAFWVYDSVDEVLKEVHAICNKTPPTLCLNKNGDLCLDFVFETYRSIDNIRFTLTKKYVEQGGGNIMGDMSGGRGAVNEQVMKEFDNLKNEVSKLRGEINLLKITLEAKEDSLNEKQRLFEEKMLQEKEDEKTINEKDEKIEQLIKRIESLEKQGKKYEEFMNKKVTK